MKCMSGHSHRRRLVRAASGRSPTMAALCRTGRAPDTSWCTSRRPTDGRQLHRERHHVRRRQTPRVDRLHSSGAIRPVQHWDLAPDGKRVAALVSPEIPPRPRTREHEIVMLQNFADELRRRVPSASSGSRADLGRGVVGFP